MLRIKILHARTFFNEDYKNNKFNIEILNKKNFTLFRIKNFLDENSYEFMSNSFPEIDSKRLAGYDLEKRNYKYTLISTDADYQQLLDKMIDYK